MAVARTQLEEAWAPQEELQQALRELHAVTARLPGGDGEDLAQEALARAVANGVSPTTVPWLITVAKRVAIDRYRRSREVASGDGSDLERIAPAMRSGPEEAVMTADGVRSVRQALATLPPRYREALMVFVEEGSASGVAKSLGMTPHATWTLLSRARERLRKELDKVGYIPAAIVAKFGKLIPTLVAGAIAVTVAVSVSLPSPRPPAPTKAPQQLVHGSSASVSAELPSTASSANDPVVRRTAGAEAVSAPAVKPKLAVSASGCTPTAGGTGTVPFGASVLMENQDDQTAFGAIAGMIPETLQGTDARGC